MTGQFYSTGDVAREAGVQRYQLEYLLETRQIPEPVIRVAGKRVWNEAELEQAMRILHQEGRGMIRGRRRDMEAMRKTEE